MSPKGERRVWWSACLLSVLSLLAWAERLTHTGLALKIVAEDGSQNATYTHANLGTSRIDALLARGARPNRAEWTGYWQAPPPGFTELVVKSEGDASVELDGVAVLGIGPNQTLNNRASMPVLPGPHHLRVVYWPRWDLRREVFLKGVTADGRSIPLERGGTSPEKPSTLDPVMDWAQSLLPVGALLTWGGFLALRIRDKASVGLAQKGPGLLLALITLLAALFRFEAVVITYWGVDAPDWADALASEISAARPGGFEHAPTSDPYRGDPFSYLTLARSMGSFYEPSAREPMFPALTRFALYLAGGYDIGINFLSALSSTLICVAIFWLGWRLLSPWTGVLAAFLWAIEWQAISFSVLGWRDDLFTLEVTACAAALISLHLAPSRLGAAFLGIAGGITLLTRLSALTFLVPGLLAAVLLPSRAPRRERQRAAGVAVLWMLLLAGPFMAACALGFGDPFYAVNVHASFYRKRAGLQDSGGSTALQFLAQSRLPWEFLQTGFVGLTSYPFLNKWSGLGAFFPGLGEIVRSLALVGLPILLWRPGGGVALVVLFSSILPYAWTWGILGGNEWRFTLPAYPFYLVCAVIAFETGSRGIVGLAQPGSRRQALRSALRFAATAAILIGSCVWIGRWLAWFRVSEAVRHHRPALIQAGSQARLFFASGWKEIDNGTRAFSMGENEARIRIPLSDKNAVRIVLRLGSSDASPSGVDVFAGGERLASLSGTQGQGETATIEVARPPESGKGLLELRFVRTNVSMNHPPFTLLWVRVEPSSNPPL